MSSDPLQHAEWLARPEVQAIFAALDGGRRRTRAVGGVVRDTIMGRVRAVADIDMATELLPEEVVERAAAAGIASYPTGFEHGTVTLKLGETLVEVTTLRQDVETDGRHAVVAFGTDWVEDARRRDFTLNALYCAADGTLYDPLGGADDARRGLVRFIGNAHQRIAEDGLRVYRFFRLSASHGEQQFDAEGLAACAAAAHRLDHLSHERVGGEMLRMLALPKVAATLAQMVDIGLLQLSGHTLAALHAYEQLGGAAAVTRLALIAQGDVEALRERWRLSNATVSEIATTERAAHLLADDRVAEAAYRSGEAAVDGLALAAVQNNWSRARLAETARMLGALVIGPFPINGRDLTGLGITPGPALGAELARLERLWIDSDFTLDREALLAHVVI